MKMDEIQKQEFIRSVIEPRTDELLKELNTVFNPRTIKEADYLQKQHSNLSPEELLRPFTI